MRRREFIKYTVAAAAVASTGVKQTSKASAGNYLRLANKDNPSVGEQKHVPKLTLPKKVTDMEWFEVKVDVGFMKEHPSTPEHWITMIQLLVDGKEVARTEFPAGGVTKPTAVFMLQLNKTSVIEAVEDCNLHGTWISEPAKINVTVI